MGKTNISIASLFVAFGLAVCASILLSNSEAEAHTVYNNGYVYASSTNCTWSRADKSHGTGGGQHYAFTRSKYALYTTRGDLHCGRRWDRPPGYIAARYNNYKWSGQRWQVCTHTSYRYNPQTRHYHQVRVNSGTRPPCGRGHYGTTAFSYVNNGGWYGGTMWSGYHYLPA
jgi:hypothetical protein